MCTSMPEVGGGAANSGNDDDSTIHSSGPSLEVDSDDRDSALGDNQSTYTMSATSSVYNFKYENGRRYHAYAEGKYPIPNDEVEKDRLDLQHQAFRLTLDGRLYIAPIPSDVQHVLDVGCGTGIWTIEFADDHPSASVIGTDLSPIQPTSVPPNCSFLIDDCDQDWIFHNKFDYIHTRAMVAAIKDWDRFFEQAYTNLKPGGYIECQEITFPMLCHDPTVTSANSAALRWSDLFIQAAATTGLDATAPNRLGPKLRAAGFVDVRAKCYKWPVGRWAKGAKMKLLGYYVYEDVMDWMPASAMGLFTRVLKWSREEVELFLAECRRDLWERNNRHFYANTFFWVARKPEDARATNFGDQEDIREEDQLSADDSQGETGLVDATAEAEAAPSSTTGVLVDSAADPSIISPLPEDNRAEASPSLPPTASSEPRKSNLTMDDILNPAPSSSITTTESVMPTTSTDKSQASITTENTSIPASSTSGTTMETLAQETTSVESVPPAPIFPSDAVMQEATNPVPSTLTTVEEITQPAEAVVSPLAADDLHTTPTHMSTEMTAHDYSSKKEAELAAKEAEELQAERK